MIIPPPFRFLLSCCNSSALVLKPLEFHALSEVNVLVLDVVGGLVYVFVSVCLFLG